MTKTILVADDSKTIRRVVEMTFEKTGFEVVSAASAAEALERVGSTVPAVVIADVAMPNGDGYSLCTTLKGQASTQHVPVLLLAGNSEPVDETKAQLARADGHIRKPFTSGDLIDLVRKLTGESVVPDVPKSFAATLSQRAPDGVLTPRAQPTPRHAPETAASPALSPPPAEPPSSLDEVSIEEDIPFEDVEMIEAPLGPSLEPPAPPEPAEARPAVDMWSLAEGHEAGPSTTEGLTAPRVASEVPIDDAVEYRKPEPESRPGTFAAPPSDVHQQPTRDMGHVGDAVAATARAAAPAVAEVAAPATPGLSKDELTAIAREVIEQIAWEVVPDLAESIIRSELARLTAAD